MLTPQQISQANATAKTGSSGVLPTQAMTPEQAKAWIGSSSQPQDSNFISRTIDAAKSGVDEIKQGFEQGQNGTTIADPLEAGLKVGSGIVKTVTAPISAAVSPVVDPAVNAIADKVSDIPAVQKFANSDAGKTTSRVAQDVSDAANIAGGVIGGVEAPHASGAITDAAADVGNNLKNIKYSSTNATPKELPPLNTAKVSDLYNRAIKPTVAGKSTATQSAKAGSNVIDGLHAIVENKPNLTFTNADGEVTTNTTPKTVDQLSQAIGQTKASIFKQYDALAQQAGEKGVHVDAPKVASELDPVINSKSLALANPKAIEYAQEMQQRFASAGKIDAQTAQDVIQHYNDSLKAFYRNPNYDTASKAGIDALIANKLRTALDEGISGATGKQYQALKSKYGALSSMEKDVTHRATVWARQNNVGLAGNLANVATGAELVKGLITLNPVDLAVGTGIKGVQLYMKYLNNPDVGVSKIFSEIEKSARPSTGSTPQPTVISPKSDSSPDTTISSVKSQIPKTHPDEASERHLNSNNKLINIVKRHKL